MSRVPATSTSRSRRQVGRGASRDRLGGLAAESHPATMTFERRAGPRTIRIPLPDARGPEPAKLTVALDSRRRSARRELVVDPGHPGAEVRFRAYGVPRAAAQSDPGRQDPGREGGGRRSRADSTRREGERLEVGRDDNTHNGQFTRKAEGRTGRPLGRDREGTRPRRQPDRDRRSSSRSSRRPTSSFASRGRGAPRARGRSRSRSWPRVSSTGRRRSPGSMRTTSTSDRARSPRGWRSPVATTVSGVPMKRASPGDTRAELPLPDDRPRRPTSTSRSCSTATSIKRSPPAFRHGAARRHGRVRRAAGRFRSCVSRAADSLRQASRARSERHGLPDQGRSGRIAGGVDGPPCGSARPPLEAAGRRRAGASALPRDGRRRSSRCGRGDGIRPGNVAPPEFAVVRKGLQIPRCSLGGAEPDADGRVFVKDDKSLSASRRSEFRPRTVLRACSSTTRAPCRSPSSSMRVDGAAGLRGAGAPALPRRRRDVVRRPSVLFGKDRRDRTRPVLARPRASSAIASPRRSRSPRRQDRGDRRRGAVDPVPDSRREGLPTTSGSAEATPSAIVSWTRVGSTSAPDVTSIMPRSPSVGSRPAGRPRSRS